MNIREQRKLAIWLTDGDTGMSSEFMAAVALGLGDYTPGNSPHPLDPSDLRRCIRFLEDVIDPSNRQSVLSKCAEYGLQWKAISDHWPTLEALYRAESGRHTAPTLYSYMKELGL